MWQTTLYLLNISHVNIYGDRIFVSSYVIHTVFRPTVALPFWQLMEERFISSPQSIAMTFNQKRTLFSVLPMQGKFVIKSIDFDIGLQCTRYMCRILKIMYTQEKKIVVRTLNMTNGFFYKLVCLLNFFLNITTITLIIKN